MSIFKSSGIRRSSGTSSMDMCEGPLFSKIIRFAIPIILTSILQLMFNAADMAVVGQFSGSIALAAVGATGSLTNLVINVFIGLAVGVGVATAQSIGSGDAERTRRTIHTAIPTALFGGTVLTVIGVVFCRDFLEMMGTPDDVIDQAALYMRIYFCGMVFNMLYNYCASILRAAGDTKSPLRFLTLAGILNVILNLFFVIVLGMGVAGVAIATVMSQALSSVLVIRALLHRTDACHFDPREMGFHRRELMQILKVGLPAGIQGSIFAISNVIIQSSVNSFGSVVMSGHSAASNLDCFVYTLFAAFAETAINFCGQNYGARKFDRIDKVRRICLSCVVVVSLVSASLIYLFGRPLLSIYISDSPEAIEYGMIRLLYIGMSYFSCGMMDTMSSMTRGLGSSIVPMFTSIIGVCGFRISWIYLVFQQPQFHTLEMLYISYPISWIATFTVHYISHKIVLKRRKAAYAAGQLP